MSLLRETRLIWVDENLGDWIFLEDFRHFCKGRQLLQTGKCLSCSWTFSKMGLLLKERICFLWEQILSFKNGSKWEGRQISPVIFFLAAKPVPGKFLLPEFLLNLIWKLVLFVPVRRHSGSSQKRVLISEVGKARTLFLCALVFCMDETEGRLPDVL